MFFVSLIITSLILCLLFIITAKRKINVRIEFFNVMFMLNMILVTFIQFTQFHQSRQYSIAVLIMFYLLFLKRHHFKTSHGRRLILSIACHTFALIGVSEGLSLLCEVTPWYLSIPFQLLLAILLVFILTWPIYLYLTYLLSIRLPKFQTDTILVLGAGIYSEDVTPMLKARLDGALMLYHKHYRNAQYIVSGGQGPDEPIPEALAMYRYLKHQNVSSDAIIMEVQSTNTIENFRLSTPYIPQKQGICVTSEFHLLRALRIAQRERLTFVGFGTPSPITLRAKALIRDYCGLMLHYPVLWCTYLSVQTILTLFR